MINNSKTYLIFLLALFMQVGIFSQKKFVGDDFSIIKIKKKGRDTPITTKIISTDTNYLSHQKLNEDSITSTNLESISKTYLNSRVKVFNKNKFHYRKGLLLDLNLGLSPKTFGFNVGLNKRFSNNVELGLGIGIFNNFYILPIDDIFLDITSFPVYGSFKYILLKRKKAIYMKGRLGYTFNSKSFNINQIDNGILVEPSIGVSFSSKNRIKHYIQLSQHISHAKGDFSVNRPNNNFPIVGSFDIWFNGTMLTYGIEIGK